MDGEKTPRTVLITKQFAEHQLSKKNLIWEGEPKRKKMMRRRRFESLESLDQIRTENDKTETLSTSLRHGRAMAGYPFSESKAGRRSERKFKLNFMFTFNVCECRPSSTSYDQTRSW